MKIRRKKTMRPSSKKIRMKPSIRKTRTTRTRTSAKKTRLSTSSRMKRTGTSAKKTRTSSSSRMKRTRTSRRPSARRHTSEEDSRTKSVASRKSCLRKTSKVARPNSRISEYINKSQNAMITNQNQYEYWELVNKTKKHSRCSLFEHKEYFPQQLRNYIDILNELFDRQNEIIFSGADANLENMRQPLIFPPIEDLQPTLLLPPPPAQISSTPLKPPTTARQYNRRSAKRTAGKKASKLKENDTIRYLTAPSRRTTRQQTTGKDYVVAMAAKGSKKKKKKTAGRKSTAKTAKRKTSKENVEPNLQSVFNYQLSDLENLKNGTTAVPNETLVGRIFSFRAEPPKPFIYAFRIRLEEKVYYYKPGHVAATFKQDGTGLVTYPNGDTAITITEGRIGKRLVVYSPSDEENRPLLGNLPMAIFDNLGNGVVFDSKGNIRLNYDQGGGVLYDTPTKIPIHWSWTNSQLLIKRKQDLEFSPEDDPDNDVPNTPIVYDNLEDEADKNKKKKNGKIGRRSVKSGKGGTGKSGKGGTGKLGKRGTGKSGKHVMKSAKEGNKRAKKKMKLNIIDSKTKSETITKDEKDDVSLSVDAAMFKLNKVKAVLEKFKTVTSIKTEPIPEMKPLVMKITKNISIKILHQEHIHIDFLYTPVFFSLNIGTRIYPEILERIDKIIHQPGDKRKIPCYFEFLNKKTVSLHDLYQKRLEMIEAAKREAKRQRIKNAKVMGTFLYMRKKQYPTANNNF